MVVRESSVRGDTGDTGETSVGTAPPLASIWCQLSVTQSVSAVDTVSPHQHEVSTQQHQQLHPASSTPPGDGGSQTTEGEAGSSE